MKEGRDGRLMVSPSLAAAEMLPWEEPFYYWISDGVFQKKWLILLPSVTAESRPETFLN